jgi:phytoene dehydrogenase-like protein
LLHDHCSAFHPMAVGSPLLTSLDLGRHGLQWLNPEVDLAHPLDDGSAGVMFRDIDRTAAGLGVDGKAWKRTFGPFAAAFDTLKDDLYGPVAGIPSHPIRLTRFGLRALAPSTLLAKVFKTPQGKALWGGSAAHALAPMNGPMSSAIGMALISAGHRYGWSVARGGSRAITDALAAELLEHGGKIETGVRVTTHAELGDADTVAFDLAPSAVADIMGERMPARIARAYRAYKHGPGAFKVDLAVEGGVPWTNEDCRRAGTVHAVGSFEELVAAEADINRGRMPARPCVLVGQQYLADPSRSAGDFHPVWAYAHVPPGYDGDATEVLLDQIERFAPGLRERIVGRFVRPTAEMPAYNANYIGGDIITGANSMRQIAFRPRITLSPYDTGADGVYICSAATPPGAGVHGMNGFNAAQRALKRLQHR